MPSNFDFLQAAFPDLCDSARQAEQLVFVAPRASCFYARFALEHTVRWLYTKDPYLQLPYETSLGALIHEPTFKNNLKPGLFPKIRTIHKVGNRAVHDAMRISERDSQHLVQELFHVLYWLARFYGPDGRNLPALDFQAAIIPRPTEPPPDQTREELQELAAQLSQADKLRQLAETRAQQTEAELTALKAQIQTLKAQNTAVTDTHDYNEAETRHYLIDVLLQEAGWDVQADGLTEVPVTGMPNASGTGRVDYVLWGADGKPLALVEAKRTTANAEQGKHQAKLYADCLEQHYGQRPIIFYTNGYETWLWDDRRYPPRLIAGFLKRDELERLIFRRTQAKALHQVELTTSIIDRSYQQEAIRRITEAFTRQERKALLVMATGTGKTRTAIALVDLLLKANWLHRVLFLADRNALLTQAFRAFQRHLPQVTTLDLTQHRAVEGARVVLSTYPTMLNAINRTDSGPRAFGPGYFDLVLVDEAHRSIYQKYGALFEYFDALLVGLTATPRAEVDRDTYRIFELEQGVPTFAYELADAVNDHHLVPPQGVTVPFQFLRTGVRYSDLSPAEQAEYEEKFRDEDTGELPEQVNASALNQWLFNENTVDQALEVLMTRGLKVDGGDRLGKTIIFARNHHHAEFIVKRFDHNYPHHKGQFAQVIDSHNPYAQSLLDDFSQPAKEPTIAVSVDMLDTGVDVPEVVNLVFFKPVFSRVKFNQMIGRGTRLCPDLFGLGNHKTHFLVFDLCSNFEYFNQSVPETNQRVPVSLTARLVQRRLELATQLQTTAPDLAPALHASLLDALHQHVAAMPPANVLVRPHLRQVEEFSQRERWEHLSVADQEAIATQLAALPTSLPRENPLTKQFDLLCLRLQLALLQATPDFERLRDQVRDLATQLAAKRDIPMIQPELERLAVIQDEDWWRDVTLDMVEETRLALRQLVPFIDRQAQTVVYTDFTDQLGTVAAETVPIYQPGFSARQYQRKVEDWLRKQANHVAIAKLKRNQPLTDTDLQALEELLFQADVAESRDRFESVFGKDKSLKQLIREIVGLDRAAARDAFAQYLDGTTLSADQIHFVEQIINFLTQRGVMDPGQLYESPFTDRHQDGLDGLFSDRDADTLVAIIQSFNATVNASFGQQAAS